MTPTQLQATQKYTARGGNSSANNMYLCGGGNVTNYRVDYIYKRIYTQMPPIAI